MEEQQQEGDKISKQYEGNLKKLVALLGGPQIFKKPKVGNNQVASIVEELVKEEKAQVIETFKVKAKEILQKKTKFDQEVKKAQEDLAKLILQKKKEFSEEMKNLFNLVENIQEIESQYNSSITEAFNDDSKAV